MLTLSQALVALALAIGLGVHYGKEAKCSSSAEGSRADGIDSTSVNKPTTEPFAGSTAEPTNGPITEPTTGQPSSDWLQESCDIPTYSQCAKGYTFFVFLSQNYGLARPHSIKNKCLMPITVKVTFMIFPSLLSEYFVCCNLYKLWK